MAISCEPNSLLASANCILDCLTPGQMEAIQTKLLCDIASVFTGGGGGGGAPWVLKAGDTMTGNLVMSGALIRTPQVGASPRSGLNLAGNSVIINSGQSTGTGAMGEIVFQQSSPGGAGSGVNALITTWKITTSGHLSAEPSNTYDIGNPGRPRNITAIGIISAGALAGTNNSGNSALNLGDTAGSPRIKVVTSGDGILSLSGSGVNTFSRLCLAGITNSGGAIGFDAINGFTLQSGAATATWNDSSSAGSATVAERYLWGIATPTLTSTNTLVTYTRASSFFIGGAPVASTNVSIGTAYALNVSTGVSNFGGNINMPDVDIVLGTGAGTKIGTATGQKLAFWNKAPIVQPTNAIAAAAFVANTSGIANDTATFGGYTIGQIAAALIATGILT